MLILGGAIGNFIDRLFRGEVVDFLDVLIPVIDYDFLYFVRRFCGAHRCGDRYDFRYDRIGSIHADIPRAKLHLHVHRLLHFRFGSGDCRRTGACRHDLCGASRLLASASKERIEALTGQ